MQTPSWHPDIALADLRIRQGRLAEAEALLLGKDQAMQALLPAARLHLARGDHDLAACRGPARPAGRSATTGCGPSSCCTVLVDAELGRGRRRRRARGVRRAGRPHRRPRRRRRCSARRRRAPSAGALAATGDARRTRSPRWRRRSTGSTRGSCRGCAPRCCSSWPAARAGRRREPAAALDARAAAAAAGGLDVVVDPRRRRPARAPRPARPTRPTRPGRRAARDGKWWVASCGGASVRLPGHEGPALPRRAGRPPGRRAPRARPRRPGRGRRPGRRARPAAPRRRRRGARQPRPDGLPAPHRGAAGARPTTRSRPGSSRRPRRTQAELDQLVAQLAQAFGLGGRERRGGVGGRAGPPQRHPGAAGGDRQARRRPARGRRGARPARPHRPVLRLRTRRPATRCAGSFSPD